MHLCVPRCRLLVSYGRRAELRPRAARSFASTAQRHAIVAIVRVAPYLRGSVATSAVRRPRSALMAQGPLARPRRHCAAQRSLSALPAGEHVFEVDRYLRLGGPRSAYPCGRGWRRDYGADVAIGRFVEVDDHRRMIARSLAFPGRSVYPRSFDPGSDWFTGQD